MILHFYWLFYWYLFQLIVLLNPVLTIGIVLHYLELKVTTGTWSFALVIANVVALFASQMTRFSYQFKSRVTSQFIGFISRVLQKLLKPFNGKTLFTFVILALSVLSIILDLNLNALEFVVLSSGSSLQYSYEKAEVFA